MDNKAPTAEVSELEFRKIDGTFETDELLERIREILEEGDSHNAAAFSKENWVWQYENLPSHDARIYLCCSENKIVGYYHVPIYEGIINDRKKNFAMVQDVAVSASMRGRSVFRKLAEFATNDLSNSDINLIYTFPNQKSIRTFLKYNNYQQVYTFDSYILPVNSSAVIKSKAKLFGFENLIGWFADRYFDFRSYKLVKDFTVETEQNFDKETVELFQNFNSKFSCHLNRTQNFLQWRFFDKPVGKHFLVTLKTSSTVFAAAVFKLDEILETRTAVLLDFAFKDELHLVQLLHYVRKNNESLFGEQINMLFTACCCHKFLQDKLYGFIKIPRKFNPRPLNLLVKNITENEDEVFDAKEWLALLSDWDVL